MFQAIDGGQWPRAYRSATALNLLLSQESNFYQLPLRIQNVQVSADALLLRADVCAEVGCSSDTLLHKNLRLVTRADSQAGKAYTAGEVTEVVGIFSVHLGRALSLTPNATTAAQAVAVSDALEFYVFGRATKPAVRNSQCQPEK
jgi:hypothetical protein